MADGYWIPGDGRKKRQSRSRQGLTYPNAQRSQPGSHQSQGLRSPSVGIAEVHVSIDDGLWQRADLADATNDNTWAVEFGWEATPGDHNIRVRATDRNGVVQDGTPRSVAPDGATGYHQRRVTVR